MPKINYLVLLSINETLLKTIFCLDAKSFTEFQLGHYIILPILAQNPMLVYDFLTSYKVDLLTPTELLRSGWK
jgi:hypothetical protein